MNGSDIESSTVLIIDDDPDIRWTLSALLKSEGFQTLEAEDGARALAVVRDGRADRSFCRRCRRPGRRPGEYSASTT